MFDYTCRLESMIRYKDKDIERLSYLNQYLTESQKKRDDIILDSQKEIQRLKQLLILFQKKIAESSKKENKDLNFNSFQADTETTLGSQWRPQLPLSRNKIERSKMTAKKPTDTNRIKTHVESKIPVNRVVKPIGILESLDIRVADSMQFMIDNVNQDNKKGKNFFALDEDATISSSLKENESFKFLVKVTKEENIFTELVANINYRGTYQMFESIRMITVGMFKAARL